MSRCVQDLWYRSLRKGGGLGNEYKKHSETKRHSNATKAIPKQNQKLTRSLAKKPRDREHPTDPGVLAGSVNACIVKTLFDGSALAVVNVYAIATIPEGTRWTRRERTPRTYGYRCRIASTTGNMTLPWSENAAARPSPAKVAGLLEKKYLNRLAFTRGEEAIERFATPEDHSSLLEYMCASESVSLGLLKPLLKSMRGFMPEEYWSTDPRPAFSLCANKNVSLETFELLLEYFPKAAIFTSSQFCNFSKESPEREHHKFSVDAYLLHIACANEFCPDSILKLLLKTNPSALSNKCVLGDGSHRFASQDGTPDDDYFENVVDGTPLHYLFKMRSALRLSTVQMVVGCDQSVVAEMGVNIDEDDEVDYTPPLHCLLWNESIGEMGDILRYILLSMKEQGIGIMDNRFGESPLHQICLNPKATSNAVKIILQEIPDNPVLIDWHQHPVHHLCENDQIVDSESIDILDLFMELDPHCIQLATFSGRVPLHLAARYKGIDFVKHVVGLYPQAVQKEEEHGRLPIHHACSEGNIDVCKFLLDLWPESLTKTDNKGWAPIHYAAWRDGDKKAAEIIGFLLEKDASLAMLRTQKEQLPFHLSCQRQHGSDCTEALAVLFDAFPEAIGIKVGEPHKRLRGRRRKTRLFLKKQMQYYKLSKHIDVLSAPNELGELTLHRAVRSEATFGAVKLLVKAYPDAVRAVDANNDSPLHVACGGFGGCDIVAYLIAQHPPALLSRNRKGLLPLHILCTTKAQREENDVGYTDCLFKMLRATPDEITAWVPEICTSTALPLPAVATKTFLFDQQTAEPSVGAFVFGATAQAPSAATAGAFSFGVSDGVGDCGGATTLTAPNFGALGAPASASGFSLGIGAKSETSARRRAKKSGNRRRADA